MPPQSPSTHTRTIIAVALLLAAIAFMAMAVASATALGYLLYVLTFGVFALVGAVLAIRRPANPIGWLFLVIGVVAEGSQVANNGGPVDPAGGAASILRLIAIEAWVVPFGLLPVLLILFPTGRPPTRRWWLPIGVAAFIILFGELISTDTAGNSILSFVFGSGAAPLAGPLQGLTGVGLIGLFVVAVASLFRRRRSASVEERQQLKWVAYAGALLATAFLATFIAFFTPLRQFDPEAPFPAAMFGGIPFVIGLVAVPIAVGVAVLRYRLYEIDALISRTLAYAIITAILGGSFVAAQELLKRIFIATTGASSDLAVVLALFVIVTLFSPLRERVQAIVDRRLKPAGSAEAPASTAAIADALRTLAKLRDEGILTDADFERKKQELLIRI